LQGSAAAAAQVLLLGDTHPAEAEQVVDAVALDCWHAAMEDVDEVLPAEQYSERVPMQPTQEKRRRRQSEQPDQTTLSSSALAPLLNQVTHCS